MKANTKADKVGVVRRGMVWVLDFLFLSILFFPATYLYSGKWVMRPEEHLWGISDTIYSEPHLIWWIS